MLPVVNKTLWCCYGNWEVIVCTQWIFCTLKWQWERCWRFSISLFNQISLKRQAIRKIRKLFGKRHLNTGCVLKTSIRCNVPYRLFVIHSSAFPDWTFTAGQIEINAITGHPIFTNALGGHLRKISV